MELFNAFFLERTEFKDITFIILNDKVYLKITQFIFSIKKDYYLFMIHIANKLSEEYII